MAEAAPKNAAGYALGPAYSDDEHHGWAVWSVGTRGDWHLCESCARLPRFKRFTKRVWIGPSRVGEGARAKAVGG